MLGIIKSKLKLFEKVIDTFPEFRFIGDPILRTSTLDTDLSSGIKTGEKLGEILINYRQLVGFGRGLAAPQIGINHSVFVTYLGDEIQIYINPKIIGRSDETNYIRELCLSSGIVWADVKRSATIKLQWTDKYNIQHTQEFSGLEARLIQHEYDHLLGIVNLDKAEPGSIELALNDPLQEKLRNKK